MLTPNSLEVIGYPETGCGVPPVASRGNAPSFQLLELIYNPLTRNTNCGRLTGNALSFSYTVVSTLASLPAGCVLLFYNSDSCYNDGPGADQLMASATNACQTPLKGKKSVRMFC